MRAWLRARAADTKTGRNVVEEMMEASAALAWVADAAMGADVIVMAEHGLTKEAMQHALEWVGEVTGMTGVGAAAIPGMAGGAAAGVAVMWDPAHMRRCGAVERGD